MMSANVVPMTPGTFQLASINYYPDLGISGGQEISLGFIAELIIPSELRGLGLIARTKLTDAELGAMDEIGRRLLSNPFTFFSDEFDLAWKEAADGAAIKFLAARHPYSIRVCQPSVSGL